MAIEETTYSILTGNAALMALSSGLASRIKPPGDWQFLTRPYIIYSPITFSPTHIHDHVTTALINHYPNFQINVVANSYDSARAVANAVITAIRGTANGNHSGTQYFLRNQVVLDFDTDRKIQEIALDFEVFTP